MQMEFNEWLRASLPKLAQCRALLGFDGFIDTPAKLQSITGMRDLADYLTKRDGMSGALELDEMPRKLGGNMPITANALGCLGLKSACIGAVDDPMFEAMSKNCILYPIAPPGRCTALEFESGKLMLSSSASIRSLDYAVIIDKIPTAELIDLHNQADLWGYFNWSELPGMTDILSGLLREIMPNITKKPRILFIDLSDCTGRSHEDITGALKLLTRFNSHAETVLSLNENEARQLLRAYKIPGEDALSAEDDNAIQPVMQNLHDYVGLNHMVIRKNRRVYAGGTRPGDGFAAINTQFVDKPKLMTGAGDNFNGGIAAALLMGANWTQALTLGTMVSSYYIRNGVSPGPQALVDKNHANPDK